MGHSHGHRAELGGQQMRHRNSVVGAVAAVGWAREFSLTHCILGRVAWTAGSAILLGVGELGSVANAAAHFRTLSWSQ